MLHNIFLVGSRKPLRPKSGSSFWHTCWHYRLEAINIVLEWTRLDRAFGLGIAPPPITGVMLALTMLEVGTIPKALA